MSVDMWSFVNTFIGDIVVTVLHGFWQIAKAFCDGVSWVTFLSRGSPVLLFFTTFV